MQYLSDVLKTVAAFPELYLGKPSLERLYAYIGGFLHANRDADDGCLDGFNDYIYNCYHINTDHNWSSIIQLFSNSDAEAFENFIKVYNEFSIKQGLGITLCLDRKGTIQRLKEEPPSKIENVK